MLTRKHNAEDVAYGVVESYVQVAILSHTALVCEIFCRGGQLANTEMTRAAGKSGTKAAVVEAVGEPLKPADKRAVKAAIEQALARQPRSMCTKREFAKRFILKSAKKGCILKRDEASRIMDAFQETLYETLKKEGKVQVGEVTFEARASPRVAVCSAEGHTVIAAPCAELRTKASRVLTEFLKPGNE